MKLLNKYHYYAPAVQSPKENEICTHILYAWSLCKSDIHLIAYMLDIRCTRSTLFMPGDSMDSFLSLIRGRLNDDAKYWSFELEYNEYRRARPPYNTGLNNNYTDSILYYSTSYTITIAKQTLQHRIDRMEALFIRIRRIGIGYIIGIIGQV